VTCEELRAGLGAYLDRELGVAHSLDAEEHLTFCMSCQWAYAKEREFRTLLKTRLLRPPAPAGLRARIRAALDAEARPRFRALLTGGRRWAALPVALLVLLALAVGLRPLMAPAPPPAVSELVAQHQVYSRMDVPAEIVSTDQAAVASWLEKRVRFAVPVPDFSPAGIRLIGARLFHVLDHWPHEYALNPIRALYFWEGGLAIWGGVAGGMLALVIFARRRGLSLGRLADTAALGLALAMGVGRLACIITGDAMGPLTSGPFGFAYTNPRALVPQLGVFYTPMPVYELVVNLGIFALLWTLRRRRWPDGALFLVFLGLYGVERFLLAFTSSYQVVAFGLTQSQIVALAALAIALPLAARTFFRTVHARPT